MKKSSLNLRISSFVLTSLILYSGAVGAKAKIAVRSVREPQSISSQDELPVLTSDIYILDKIIQPNGKERDIPSKKAAGRFISFSSYSSLSGFDGCHWFQHKYVFSKKNIELKKNPAIVGECDKYTVAETLPPSPFSVKYQAQSDSLTLTSVKTKLKFIYRKNVADSH